MPLVLNPIIQPIGMLAVWAFIGVMQAVEERIRKGKRGKEVMALVFGLVYGGFAWGFVLYYNVDSTHRWGFAHDHIYDSLGAAALVGTMAFVFADTKNTVLRAAILGVTMALVGGVTAFSASASFPEGYITAVVVPGLFGVWVVVATKVTLRMAPSPKDSGS